MSFLAPLFLLGAAAVALPIVFHLIRRSSRERVPFSSLMFLQPTPPRVTRRSKLENVLLLLLRCAVIGLLAFAFGRPYFSAPVAPDLSGKNGQKVLLLVDASASMRRGNLWTAAKDKARELFNNTSMADQVAVYAFDNTDRPLLTFEQWAATPSGDRAALAAKRLDEAGPTWGATRLGPALLHGCEMFESTKDEQIPKRIVVISDFQEGARLDGLQGFEWPRGVRVEFEAVRASATSNAGLQLAVDRDERSSTVGESVVRIRVSNASDSKREQFKVGWVKSGALAGPTLDTYVPPGQSRILSMPLSTNSETLSLTGDDYDFDNVVYVLPASAEQAKIVYLGKDTGGAASDQALYYLRRAFQQTRRVNVEVATHDPARTLDPADLAGVPLIVVASALSEGVADAVRQALTTQASVLCVLGDNTMGPTARRLLGQEDLGFEEVETPANAYAMLGQIDFAHPLFAPFADPRYSDFTKIHFWKHRRLSVEKVSGARVLARFDNNDPALVEVPVGKGKLWLMAAGWQPSESQFALSSKFVPLLYAMLEQSGAGVGEARRYQVGDPVEFPGDAESVTIRKPDASEVKVSRGERFTSTDQPGVYTVTSTQPPLRFTVNLAPDESRTAPLSFDELERMGVPIGHQLQGGTKQVQQRREHLQAAQLESRQKLWRWLIVAALVVLMSETWLAGRLTRRAVPQ